MLPLNHAAKCLDGDRVLRTPIHRNLPRQRPQRHSRQCISDSVHFGLGKKLLLLQRVHGEGRHGSGVDELGQLDLMMPLVGLVPVILGSGKNFDDHSPALAARLDARLGPGPSHEEIRTHPC